MAIYPFAHAAVDADTPAREILRLRGRKARSCGWGGDGGSRRSSGGRVVTAVVSVFQAAHFFVAEGPDEAVEVLVRES